MIDAPRLPLPGVLPPPDRAIYRDNLFGNAWASILGFDGLGNAYFDIPATGGSTSGGLRVFLQGTLAGAAGDRYVASVVRDTTTAVAIDTAAKTIVVDAAASATLSALKTAIDAEATLTSRYYDDGAAGNTAALVAERRVEAGHAPEDVVARVVATGTVLVYVGPEAPDSDIDVGSDTGIEGVRIQGASQETLYVVPAGSRIWLRRAGSSDLGGSLEIWRR